MFVLTHKQLLELKYWCTCGQAEIEHEFDMRSRYFKAFGFDSMFGNPFADKRILEIGTGPLWGLLPIINSGHRTGIDSLYDVYQAMGLLAERGDIWYVNDSFELWETNERYDAIITTNALDHGEMGFHLIVKMWSLLNSGGRIYIHVHLRPPALLNLIHDHALTEAQLDRHLRSTDLIQEKRTIYKSDVDETFCPALVGIWRKP